MQSAEYGALRNAVFSLGKADWTVANSSFYRNALSYASAIKRSKTRQSQRQ